MTKWVAHHPGGHLPIINMSGRDATDVFAQFHPASTYNKLKAFHVADIIDKPEPCEIVKDFRQIRQELLRQGKILKENYKVHPKKSNCHSYL